MTFDASLYETIPQTNVAGTLALVRAVITASKGVSLPAGRKALHRVRAAGEALRTQHQAVPPVKAESVTRATDAAIDRIWSAFAQRLAASIELGGAEGARRRASTGCSSRRGSRSCRSATGAVGRGRGDPRGSARRTSRYAGHLVGALFSQLRARQAAYGEALGITKAKAPAPEAVSLVEPLREARAALGTFARVLIAAVENGDFDEAAATPMLEPLVALRTSLRTKRRPAAGEPIDAAPVSPEPLPTVD